MYELCTGGRGRGGALVVCNDFDKNPPVIFWWKISEKIIHYYSVYRRFHHHNNVLIRHDADAGKAATPLSAIFKDKTKKNYMRTQGDL